MRIEKLKQKIRALNIDAQEIASTLDDLKSVKSVREVDLELQASIQATAAQSHMFVLDVSSHIPPSLLSHALFWFFCFVC
jgi:hypothetical protein